MRCKYNYPIYLLVILLFVVFVLAVLLNPVVENRAPYNNTHDYVHSINFSYNVTDETVGGVIDNCSLFLKHSYGGNWERNKTDTLAGGIAQGIKNNTLNLTMLHENVYWKVGCHDNDSIQVNSSTFNLTIYDKELTTEITFPKNNTHTYVHSVNYTYNVTGSTYINVSNCSLFLKHSWAGNWERNKTDAGVIEKLVNQTLNLTMLHENVYWKTGCYSNLSEQYNSSTFNLTIYDKTAAVTNRQPYNSTNSYAHAASFIYNVSLAEPSYVSISNCSLYINNGTWYVNATDTSITLDINQSINITLMHQAIKWKISCYTNLSEQFNSSAFNYTVLEEAVIDGGISRGGGPITTEPLVTRELSSSETYLNLGPGETATIISYRESHDIKVEKVMFDSVIVTVTSTPTTDTIYLASYRDFDINDDGFNELRVWLNAIRKGRADLSYKSLLRLRETATEVKEDTKDGLEGRMIIDTSELKFSTKILMVIGLVIAVILIWYFFIFKKK